MPLWLFIYCLGLINLCVRRLKLTDSDLGNIRATASRHIMVSSTLTGEAQAQLASNEKIAIKAGPFWGGNFASAINWPQTSNIESILRAAFSELFGPAASCIYIKASRLDVDR